MYSWWKRTNFLIKHQLYMRILPVVVLSVLAVGLFSGRLLTSRAVNTYLEQKNEEQLAALGNVLNRVVVCAMASEARKDQETEITAGNAGLQELAQKGKLLDQLLGLETICGAALLSLDPSARTDSFCFRLAPPLATRGNRAVLQRWDLALREVYGRATWADIVSKVGWPGGPRMVHVDDFHTVWIFEPITLTTPRDDDSSSWSPEEREQATPVLPVLVLEEGIYAYPATLRGRDAWRRAQLLLLLDLKRLTAELPTGRGHPGDISLWLDPHGRIMTASVDSLRGGLDLTREAERVFTGVTPPQLAAFLAGGSPGRTHAYLGPRWNPYIFMRHERRELPLFFVSALPFSKVHGGLVLYTAIVVLMAAISLLGSILAITQVGERLSDRLQNLSANMGQVASGEYNHRLALGQEDEVGRLISYFNVMTAGLDEAHRELREKTYRLRIALARQRRLDKAKDDFLALISHEVRTPLTSIMGGIDFLRMVLPQATPEQNQVLNQLNVPEIADIIESSGNRLRDFMNDAILMTALQSSDSRLKPAALPLVDFCELVMSGLQEEVAARELTVSIELEAEPTWLALCDRELMVTAFEKLLRNAVQHNIQEGMVRIREVAVIPSKGSALEIVGENARRDLAEKPAFSPWAAAPLQWRIIEVYNTGPVIPVEKREALFGKFEIVGRIEHHQKGSGLSLSIVQAVLENHGGKIHVESRYNDGNYFYLVIPALSAEDARQFVPGSRDEEGESIGGAAGNEEVHLSAESTGLEVELEHASP
jgi:signal transduction histidine kinase